MVHIRDIPAERWEKAEGMCLDSGAAAGEWSRWSYRLGPASLHLRCAGDGQAVVLRDSAGVVRRWDEPLAAIAWMGEMLGERPGDGPPFKGGWVGYFGYDLGRLFETIPSRAVDDLRWPLFELTWHSSVLARDLATGRCYEIKCEDPGAGAMEMAERFTFSDSPPTCNFTREGYERVVAKAIEYIYAGDIFQVNLSQRFSMGLREQPRAIYERLRRENPAWFGGYLAWGDHALVCNSPELFLRIEPQSDGGRRILTRPIKGTRPRRSGMDVELLHSMKDQAELNMIIDLERNDLGRICRIGSVRVREPRTIEAHPTVYHGVATVEGLLRDDVGLVDILRATFPGGSITGAPKIRAMEIIEELEPTRRGPYCGAIGYLSADGHMEFNIAIRTMIVAGGKIHVPVGGGIVADSQPAAEYEETLVKARAMMGAIGWNSTVCR